MSEISRPPEYVLDEDSGIKVKNHDFEVWHAAREDLICILSHFIDEDFLRDYIEKEKRN